MQAVLFWAATSLPMLLIVLMAVSDALKRHTSGEAAGPSGFAETRRTADYCDWSESRLWRWMVVPFGMLAPRWSVVWFDGIMSDDICKYRSCSVQTR